MSAVSDTWGWPDVLAVAPVMSVASPEVVASAVAAARVQVANQQWGDKANLAASYLAAHHAALAMRSANGGVGPMLGGATPSDDGMSPDAWLRKYRELRDQVFRLPMVAASRLVW